MGGLIHWDTALTSVVGAVILAAITALTKMLRDYRAESSKWRTDLDKKVDNLTTATQTTMRADLCHLYEKYMTRGWLTQEEYDAWNDMHMKYANLGANGLIDGYAESIRRLPHRSIG